MQRPVSSIRSVLAGFVGLLILMGCLAVDSARQTRDVSVTSAALRKESRDRDALLDQLLADTYRSATLVRDYMLEHDEVLAASQKAELQLLRSRVEQALSQLWEQRASEGKRGRRQPAAARRIVLGFAGPRLGVESHRQARTGRDVPAQHHHSAA